MHLVRMLGSNQIVAHDRPNVTQSLPHRSAPRHVAVAMVASLRWYFKGQSWMQGEGHTAIFSCTKRGDDCACSATTTVSSLSPKLHLHCWGTFDACQMLIGPVVSTVQQACSEHLVIQHRSSASIWTRLIPGFTCIEIRSCAYREYSGMPPCHHLILFCGVQANMSPYRTCEINR